AYHRARQLFWEFIPPHVLAAVGVITQEQIYPPGTPEDPRQRNTATPSRTGTKMAVRWPPL
ncbi:hypothetical protein KEM54_004921, partial [Ascosphaera aggregata]